MIVSQLDGFYRRQAPFYDITRQLILFNHKEAVDALDIKDWDIIYDIACGTGKNIPFLLKKINADQVYGWDYSHHLLGQAQKKYPWVNFIHADVTKDLSKQYSQPNKIICSYSLSMIQDREKAIKIMYKTLKPWGRLVILDFNAQYKQHSIRGKMIWRLLKFCDINLDQSVKKECLLYSNSVSINYHNNQYNLVLILIK